MRDSLIFLIKGNEVWNRHSQKLIWIGGFGMLVWSVAICLLSYQFGTDRPLLNKPIVILVSIMLTAGLLYSLVALKTDQLNLSTRHWIWIVGVGVIMRLLMLPSNSILENDYYRYLWDGAATAEGFNPFARSPADVLGYQTTQMNDYPKKLLELKQSGQAVLEKINHPSLRTIYPLTAQVLFSLAYRIKPWSLPAWRSLILLSDVIILVLLILLCRRTGINTSRIIIYWWHPLIIKEFYNNAHMDLLVFPFLLGALLAVSYSRPLVTALLTALSIGTKVWPIVLVPLYWKPLLKKKKWWSVMAAVLLLALVAALFWPVAISKLDSSSGFTAYAKSWQMNDALFMLVVWWLQQIGHLIGWSTGTALLMARGGMIAVLGTWLLWLLKQKLETPRQLAVASLCMVTAVFMLSPTQYPWYYGWVIPFLIFYPSPGLILLSVNLSLYYLRFYFKARNQVELFDAGLVWLEYGPVWIILIGEVFILKTRGQHDS